jgi:hypothetical protein
VLNGRHHLRRPFCGCPGRREKLRNARVKIGYFALKTTVHYCVEYDRALLWGGDDPDFGQRD